MLTVFPSFLLMSIDAPPSFHTEKYTAVACCFRPNRDTECSYYFALMLQMTFSVLLSYREIPFIMMQSTQSDVGVFTAIWIGWGLS